MNDFLTMDEAKNTEGFWQRAINSCFANMLQDLQDGKTSEEIKNRVYYIGALEAAEKLFYGKLNNA